jgi:hypothetical protein
LKSSSAITNGDDDEEEKFVDVKTESSDNEEAEEEETTVQSSVKKQAKADKKSSKTETQSWVHKKNIIHKSHDKYDYTQRNPLYSGADKTSTYELLLYARHYHPTVSLFANKLMNVKPNLSIIDYSTMLRGFSGLFSRPNTSTTVGTQCRISRQFTFWTGSFTKTPRRTNRTKIVS